MNSHFRIPPIRSQRISGNQNVHTTPHPTPPKHPETTTFTIGSPLPPQLSIHGQTHVRARAFVCGNACTKFIMVTLQTVPFSEAYRFGFIMQTVPFRMHVHRRASRKDDLCPLGSSLAALYGEAAAISDAHRAL